MSDGKISWERPKGHINPRVNLNGTSVLELLKQVEEVYAKANALMDALSRATPHGRDYQTYPDGLAFREAQDAFQVMFRHAHQVREEFELLYHHLLSEQSKT
jgi:hypothetical protein